MNQKFKKILRTFSIKLRKYSNIRDRLTLFDKTLEFGTSVNWKSNRNFVIN